MNRDDRRRLMRDLIRIAEEMSVQAALHSEPVTARSGEQRSGRCCRALRARQL